MEATANTRSIRTLTFTCGSNLAADVDKIMSYIVLITVRQCRLPTDPFTIMAVESRYTSSESLRLLIC